MAEVTITDVSRHDGFIAFSEKEAKIIISQHFHVHIVDLEKFESSFQNLQYTLHQIERHNTTQPFFKMLNIRMERLSDNFYRLKPVHRQKRGLLNPLGTFIKSLTGNLDDNDLLLIRQSMENSRTKTNFLINENNRQIRINQQFEAKVNDLIKHVNEHQMEILRKISRMNSNSNVQNENYLKGIVHDILFNIQLLNNQLKDIFEVVQLSRLGIVSKAILNYNETKSILTTLEDQNISISSTDQIYEFLSIQTYHEKSKIVFVIKTPIFKQGYYQYVKFETLPKDRKIISTLFNSAVLGKFMTLGVNHECSIIEKYRICKVQELTNLTGDGCIDNALRGNNASCPYEEQRDEMDIKQINEHTLIIRNAIQPILLTSSCNIKTRKMTGTLLISYNNCTISINGINYDGRKTVDHHDMRIISTIGIDFQATTILKKTDLHQVNLLRIENLNHISQLRKDHTTLEHTTTGLLTLFAVIIIGLTIWNLRGQCGTNINLQEPTIEVKSCKTLNTQSSLSSDEEHKESNPPSFEGSPNSIQVIYEKIHLDNKQQPRFQF